jgi:hypothetical protein
MRLRSFHHKLPFMLALRVFILIMLVFAVSVPHAAGWTGSAGASAPTDLTGGGGGGGGTTYYWSLENADANLSPISNLFNLNDYQGNPAAGELKARAAFLDNCHFGNAASGDIYPADKPVTGSNCPIMWSKEESNSFSYVENHDFIHYHDPLNQYLHGAYAENSNDIVAFNVKIWRFDGRSGQATPIFQRRVGVDNASSTEQGLDDPKNEFYYFMGLSLPPASEDPNSWGYANTNQKSAWACQPDGVGGSWGNGDCAAAGPLVAPAAGYNYDKQLCTEANSQAYNGERENHAGATISDTSQMDPNFWTLQGTGQSPVRPQGVTHNTDYWHSNGDNYSGSTQGTCYWEGSQIGPNYWQGESGYAGETAVKNSALYYNKPAKQTAPLTTQRNSPNPWNTPQDEFGTDGTIDTGLKEAIRLTWNIPTSSGGQAPSINYYLVGPPGVWYAVQIVAIDQRQRIIPLNASPYVDAHSGYNYFRVFQVGEFDQNPPTKPKTPKTCVPPVPNPCADYVNPCDKSTTPATEDCSAPLTSPQPSLTAALATPAATSVLNPTSQAIDLEPSTPLSNQQAIFPTEVTLDHFTPQGQYDGADPSSDPPGTLADVNAASGPNAYVEYPGYSESLDYRNVSAPADWQLMPNSEGGVFPGLWMASMPEASSVLRPQAGLIPSGTDLSDPPYSFGLWETEWLRPTLNNPCVDSEPTEANTPWPSNRRVCQGGSGAVQDATAVRNAWDDYFSAQTEWEARFLGSDKLPANNNDDFTSSLFAQLLRCGDNPVSVGYAAATTPHDDDNCGDQWQELRWFGSQVPQDANGYIDIDSNPDQPVNSPNTGQARIVLKTNQPNDVLSAAVWGRETGNLEGRNPSTTLKEEDSDTAQVINGHVYNTRTYQPEMNFCQQGIHPGSFVYQSASDPTKDDVVGPASAATGDQDCRGFDVQWHWANTDSSCDVAAQPVSDNGATDAKEIATTPPASAFPAPTAYFLDPNTGQADGGYPAVTQIAASWGVWGDEPGSYDDGSKAYYTGTNNADAQAAGFSSAWSADTDLRNNGAGLGIYANNAVAPPYAAIGTSQGEIVNPQEGRPGNGYVEQRCTRTVSGVWKTGHWQKFWTFTSTPNACLWNDIYDGWNPAIVFEDDLTAPGNPTTDRPANATDPESNPYWTYCNTTQSLYTAHYASGRGTDYTHCDTTVIVTSKTQGPCYTNVKFKLQTGGTKKKPIYTTYYENNQAETWSTRPKDTSSYAFGYWHYEWAWYWGQTQQQYDNDQPANPENCFSTEAGDKDPQAPNGITSLSQTEAAGNYEYAGPLTPHDDYGRTQFVWSHAGPTRSTDPTYGRLESKYAADVYNGQLTYANNTTTSGIWGNSWSCQVTRTDGYRQSGAWGLDSDTGTPASAPNGYERAIYGAMDDHDYANADQVGWADAGWGNNNTGAELSDGDYSVQFGFNPDIPQTQLPSGGANLNACSGEDHDTPANTTLYPDPSDPGGVAANGPTPAVCWRLSATYDGDSYWDWKTVWGENDPTQDAGAQQVVKVYQTRDNR